MNNQEKIFIGIAIFIAAMTIFGPVILPILFFLAIGFLIKNFHGGVNNFSDFINQQNNFRGKMGSNENLKEKFFGGKEKISDIKNKFNKNNFLNMNNLKGIAILPIVGLLIGFAIIMDGIVNVPAGSVAVIFDRGQGVLKEPLGEGIHLKIPFWQKSTVLTTRVQAYTMSSTSGEGKKYGDDAISALTKDGQKVSVDITVQFNLEKEKAPGVYQKIGLDYIDKIVRPGIRSIARENITKFDSKELFQNETRQEVQTGIKGKMQKYLENENIKLVGVLVRNIEFSKVYLDAIEEKQVAQQKIQKSEYEKQQASIIKETKIIQAEAEAKSIELKGKALKANKEIIQLQMIDKLAPNIKWGVLPDGVMPLIDMKNMQ